MRKGMVCWSCKHFEFDPGFRGYSDQTPGELATMECKMNVWTFGFYGSGDDGLSLEETLKTAETCEQFEARETGE